MWKNRRHFLAASSALAISPFLYAQPAKSTSYADPNIVAAWVDKWAQSLKAVSEPLVLGRFADHMYYLYDKISWSPNSGQEELKPVNVPKGFVTDLASVPQIFWSLLPPDGPYIYAAIIHDYLYWEQPLSRQDADLVLKKAMEDFEVNPVTIAAVYAGVRAGGGFSWDANARLKREGGRRVISKFPADPKIKWADYSKKRRCFLT